MQTPVTPDYFRLLAHGGSRPGAYFFPPIASEMGT
jgi:hypothetical protein